MSEIQRARDVLAKWRGGTSPGPWQMWPEGSMHDQCGHAVSDGFYQPEDSRLIVGTAGNPDLLDAIDAMLAATLASYEAWGNRVGQYTVDPKGHIASLVAGILSADERMRS